jgi:hypothetical protein
MVVVLSCTLYIWSINDKLLICSLFYEYYYDKRLCINLLSYLIAKSKIKLSYFQSYLGKFMKIVNSPKISQNLCK